MTSEQLGTEAVDLPDPDVTCCDKCGYMCNYLPANHSCLALYWRSSNDVYTRCQRRQLCLWLLILVLLQNVTSYWLLYAYGQTRDWIDTCYDYCKEADSTSCITENLGSLELDDAITFSLVTFGNKDYFVYNKPARNSQAYEKYQSCEDQRMRVNGKDIRPHCEDGCLKDGEYTVSSCYEDSPENFGLLCRHPDALPNWKRFVWYYLLLPFLFYVILFPLRDIYLYTFMPCLNSKNKFCSCICHCFLYPQLLFIFVFTIGVLGLAILLLWTTYRETRTDQTDEEAIKVVLITIGMASALAFVYEFLALFLDFWLCKRWERISQKSVFFYFHQDTPMTPFTGSFGGEGIDDARGDEDERL